MPHNPAYGDKVAAIGTLNQPTSGTIVLDATASSIKYPHFTLTFTFTSANIDVTDAAGSGSSGSFKFFDFNEGVVQCLGSRATWSSFTEGAALTGAANDAAFVIAFGSAAANAGDGALTGTEVNFGATTSITLPSTGINASTMTAAQTPLDGTSTAVDLYLNWSGSAATIDANSTIACTGSYTVAGQFIGDD